MTQPKLWFNWGSTFVAMTTSTLFLSDPRRNIWFFVKASVIQIVMFRLESCDSRIHTHIDYSHSFISTLIIIMIIIYICIYIYIYCIYKYFNKKKMIPIIIHKFQTRAGSHGIWQIDGDSIWIGEATSIDPQPGRCMKPWVLTLKYVYIYT